MGCIDDLRPRRTQKPGWIKLLLAVLFTPACFAVPIAGPAVAIFGWFMIGRQYLKAVRDAQLPHGHFYGE